MTVELVKEIKKAEGSAETIIDDAKQEARKLLKEAELRAEQVRSEIIARAESRAKDLVVQAEAEAKAEAEPFLEEERKKILQLTKDAAEHLPQAITVLKDKVVTIDADN